MYPQGETAEGRLDSSIPTTSSTRSPSKDRHAQGPGPVAHPGPAINLSRMAGRGRGERRGAARPLARLKGIQGSAAGNTVPALRRPVFNVASSSAFDAGSCFSPPSSSAAPAEALAGSAGTRIHDHDAARPGSGSATTRSRAARRGRHGRGLSRARHQARPRRRAQGAARAHGADPERLERFDREARALAALNHPEHRRRSALGRGGRRHALPDDGAGGGAIARSR